MIRNKTVIAVLIVLLTASLNAFAQDTPSDEESFPDDLLMADDELDFVPQIVLRGAAGYFENALPYGRIRIGAGTIWNSQTLKSSFQKQYGSAEGAPPIGFNAEVSVWKNFSVFGEMALPNTVIGRSTIVSVLTHSGSKTRLGSRLIFGSV